jgi:DNA-binding LacI/PurR family transcriptional regulator
MRAAGLLPLAALPLEFRRSQWDGNAPAFTEEQMQPMQILLQSAERPTALFCINDPTAYRVMAYLLQKGYHIPQEIAIAGFDDMPLAAYMPVPLTTISQPRLDIGHQAARLLLEMIEKGLGEPRKIVLPVSLVVRSSTVVRFSTSAVSASNVAGSS